MKKICKNCRHRSSGHPFQFKSLWYPCLSKKFNKNVKAHSQFKDDIENFGFIYTQEHFGCNYFKRKK